MKRSPLVLAIAVLAAAVVTGVAAGDGPQGPAPGITAGWAGVQAPNGKVRYVAIPGSAKTTVEAVQVHGGRILRWAVVRGSYGHPLVAWDGTAGGLSGDGTTLVLTALPTPSGSPTSRFLLLSTRTMRKQALVALPGSWSFDAISPDASTLFLIQYRSSAPDSAYSVRAFDLRTRQLVPDAIVDRREEEAAMRGAPVTRKTSADGRWAYTLYARRGEPPFVHALDTVKREAVCVDLPLRLTQPKQSVLRLRFGKGATLEILNPRGVRLAQVDLQSLEARKG